MRCVRWFAVVRQLEVTADGLTSVGLEHNNWDLQCALVCVELYDDIISWREDLTTTITDRCIPPTTQTVINSIHSFIHSFIHSLTHSLPHSFIYSFTHSFINSSTPWLIHSFIMYSVITMIRWYKAKLHIPHIGNYLVSSACDTGHIGYDLLTIQLSVLRPTTWQHQQVTYLYYVTS